MIAEVAAGFWRASMINWARATNPSF
jgi:hypothetical protein